MTPDLFLRLAIEPALDLLPPAMNTPAAKAMILAICLQESGLKHRRQLGGPARGFAQFEIGGVRGVLLHPKSKPHVADFLARVAYAVTDDATLPYVAIEHNDVMAVVFARLLLWTLPGSLPDDRHDVDTGWNLYLDAWKPGKPRHETWPKFFSVGWDTVEPQ